MPNVGVTGCLRAVTRHVQSKLYKQKNKYYLSWFSPDYPLYVDTIYKLNKNDAGSHVY